jgi:hypothetical protein
MNPQLNYMMVQHRSAELRRAGERSRIASEVPARRRGLRDRNRITGPCTESRRGMTAVDVERAIGSAS